MVKQCSCGQQVTFDPINESWPLTRSQSASSVRRESAPRNADGYSTDSDVSYFGTKHLSETENVYFAQPVLLEPDSELDSSPPRPPPPEHYDLPPEWSYYSLPRKMNSTDRTDFGGNSLRKSASTDHVTNRRNVVFPTPFDRFISSSTNRQFDFQKVAG
jgi:hypothetical protein